MIKQPYYYYPDDFKKVIKDGLNGKELETFYKMCYGKCDEEVFYCLLAEYSFSKEELENGIMYAKIANTNWKRTVMIPSLNNKLWELDQQDEKKS